MQVALDGDAWQTFVIVMLILHAYWHGVCLLLGEIHGKL
jgi:hypothetical protein